MATPTRERLTVSNTAKSLTAATIAGKQMALLSVETAPIRVTFDGTDPEAGTTGHLVLPGDTIDIPPYPGGLGAVKMIREGATDADVEATYWD